MERRQSKKVRSNSKKRSELLNRKNWSEQEDEILTNAIDQMGSNWRLIALQLVGRNPSQCAQRWKRLNYKQKVQLLSYDQIVKNRKWTQEEDDLLHKLHEKYQDRWNLIALEIGNRSGRQIRERYINHLDPNLNKCRWTKKEDLKIWEAFQQYGTKWTKIGKLIPGRSENMIKNRFYSYLRKAFGNLENPYYQVTKQQDQDQSEIQNSSNSQIVTESKYKLKLRKYEEKIEQKQFKVQSKIKNYMDDFEEEIIQQDILADDKFNNFSFEEMCCTQINIFQKELCQFTQENQASFYME